MLTLPLDPTDDRANPAFRDAAGCAQWLGQLQLTNLHEVHGVLRVQLGELNRCPLRGQERLHILESLRETVSFVQADYAKKLVAKKLPLSEDELTIFVSITVLWQQMVTGYQRCLQDYLAGDKLLAPHGALLCRRCLSYSGLQISEHLHTGYEFSGKLWQQLHALYAFSEERNLHLEAAKDEPDGATTCQAVYVTALLACHARPAELSRGQLLLMDRWLTSWSTAVTISNRGTAGQGDAPPLVADLDSAQGLQSYNQVAPTDRMRYLAMVPLSKLLRVKTILLQQGQTPQQLGLGPGCNSADCGEFLTYLHRCWCEERNDRMAERRSATQSAQACYGLESIYAYSANKPFKQPGREAGTDSMARKQLATFGNVLSDTNRHNLSGMGFALETWRIEDESILGARLLRDGTVGARIGLHQIVAVRPEHATAFMLGTVSWANITSSGQLHAGIHYFPGVAQAISLKAVGANASDKYSAALLLPAVAELNAPPSLILPRNLFQPERMVEFFAPDKEKQKVKLGFSVERGLDYERVSFSAA